MADAEATTVGDRFERAIERHADTPGEIARGEEKKPGNLWRNVIWLAITGVSLYFVFPKIVDVFSSWRQITRFSIPSLALMVGFQVAANACLWDLQRLALRAPRWRPVIAAQLASTALANIAPGGGPVGAALQYRMLTQSGLPAAPTLTALTAVNLLVFAVVLALPVLAIPALLRGVVNGTLLQAGAAGLGIFAVGAAIGAVFLTTDRPLAWVGDFVQRVRNRLRAKRPPLQTLPDRLLNERNR